MKRPNPTILAQMGLLLGAALLAVGCAGSSTPKDPCTSLTGLSIPKEAIGLATNGATVTSATLVPASSANLSGAEYCKVVGVINPDSTSENTVDLTSGAVTPIATPVINFQVNLPTGWNHKTLHQGGGGFDGSIPSELDTTNAGSATANGIENPLHRGYVLVGSDSGHASAGMPTAIWNSEAMRNFGREAIKKTHDAAMAIVKARYDAAPTHNYFMGGSQGGHEALIAAQFYPEDYDGVVVGFPAYDLEAMHTGSIDYSKALYNAHLATDGYAYNTSTSSYATAGYGWISRKQMKTLEELIMAQCDAADGAADGIVSNPGDPTCKAYRTRMTLHNSSNPIRCTAHIVSSGVSEDGESLHINTSDLTAAGAGDEACLSDVQIESLTRITSRYNFAPGIALEAGLKSYGRWPMLDGIWFSADAAKDPSQEDFGGTPLPVGFAPWLGNDGAFQSGFPTTDQLNMLTRHTWTTAQAMAFDITQYTDRIMEVSSQVDTSSVDYEVFRGRGGKMIHYHGASDVSITPYNSVDLYLRMTGQFLGNTNYLGVHPFWGTYDTDTNAIVSQNSNVAVSGGIVNDFYSFYLIPGMGHGHGYYQAAVDWLKALENWRERDIAPRNTLVSTDTSTAHTSLGHRPVCYFPFYPRYTGTDGDLTKASNYSCKPLDAYSNLKEVAPVYE